MKFVHAAILAVPLATVVVAAQPSVSPLGVRVDRYLSRLVPFGFNGAVLVAQDGKIALEKGYGLANREKSIAYAADTVSTIGSITKMFTAAAILKLEMQGRLRVEDPISKYLPDVPRDKSAITIHQLLTHTAGLRPEYGGRDSDPIARDDLVKLVLTTPLASPPGDHHEYSNEGYSLLAAIVERVSGQPYEQYLRENILKPAGMMDTGYTSPAWNRDRIAHGYTEEGDWGTLPEKGWRDDGPGWFLKGNGGLHSTVGDLYRWARALETDAVLSAAEREKYTKPWVSEGPQMSSFYAYGWAVFTTLRGTKLVAHNGGNGVFAADFRRYIDEKTVVVAMSNSPMTAIDVAPPLDAVIFGRPVVMPPSVTTLPADVLAPLVGTYAVAPDGGTVTVAVERDGLRVASDDPRAFALLNFLDSSGDAPDADVRTRSRTIIEAGARGDFDAVRQAMNTDRPVERIRQNQGAMWKDRRSRIGEFVKADVLGSGRGPEGRVVYVRITGERGSEFVAFGWEGGEMMMMRPLQALPALRLLHTSTMSNGPSRSYYREFGAFRLPGKIVRARIEIARDGAPVSLTLTGVGGETLRAARR